MFYIVLLIERIVHISATRCPIEMGFRSKCSICPGQVIYIEKSKLNIEDMWLIPLDRVTFVWMFYFELWSAKCVNLSTKIQWHSSNTYYLKKQKCDFSNLGINLQLTKCSFQKHNPYCDSLTHLSPPFDVFWSHICDRTTILSNWGMY